MAKLASLTSFKEGDRRKVIHQSSRIEHWKKLFLGGFNSMFILNMIGILGLMPVILSVYYYLETVWGTAAVLPFASTIGTAIFPVVDTASIQHITTQSAYVTHILLITPLAMIVSSVLLSPFVYAMRNAEYDGAVSGYLKSLLGFKYNGLKFLGLGVISAVLFEIVAFLYYLYSDYAFANGSGFVTILMLVGIILLAVFFFIVMVHAYIITTTYKMSIFGALVRSLVFVKNLPLQCLFIFILTILPFGLCLLGSFIVSLVITLALFVGLSFMGSIWMVYLQTILSIATPQNAKKVRK